MALSPSPEIHQVLLESTHEVLGKGQSGFLQPEEKTFLTELERLLTEQFGTLTGRGMAIRMGRSGFQTGLRRWGEMLGFYSLDFRLMPFPRRVRFGLDQIARFLERTYYSPDEHSRRTRALDRRDQANALMHPSNLTSTLLVADGNVPGIHAMAGKWTILPHTRNAVRCPWYPLLSL